ncbi:MAG TPA: hypothetical protein PLJ78_02840 [Anaerolineae bacterium]|nr:hypothetical protein [Anaerolineae bacterium]HQK12863.1 hypothetical protein [Anaerolineae bacterium]
MTKSLPRLFLVTVLGVGTVALLLIALTPPLKAAPTRYDFAVATQLTPLGAGQSDALARRNAYQALWETVYGRNVSPSTAPDLAWTVVTATMNGQDYAPGAVIGDLRGNFDHVSASGPFSVPRALALHPRRVALYAGSVRDEYEQLVVWERLNFDQLFRVYLGCELPSPGTGGSCPYFDTLTETHIIANLSDYDVLILPAIRIGYTDEVVAALGDAGLQAIADFVRGGGFLYAQADAAYIAEAAGLLPAGTVNLASRVTDPDNTGQLDVLLPDHPLVFSWLSNTTYILNEPTISAGDGLSVVARFADTSHPGSVAIGVATPGDGRVVLFNAHPSDDITYHPQVLNALLWAMGERAGLYGTLWECPTATPLAVGCDTIPAYEAGVPIAITTTFKNYWDGPLTNVIITETLHRGFTTSLDSIVPAPTALITTDDATTIVWTLPQASPGAIHFTYIAYTTAPSGTVGTALVSTARATYTDPFHPTQRYPTGLLHSLTRNALQVKSLMAARLVGDRDIELDGLYPLPAGGYYFDIALTLENKEETDAYGVVITDVVALLSPIVDVDDQRIVPHVIADSWGPDTTDSLSQTMFALNEIFFYETPVPVYPLPVAMDGVPAVSLTTGVFYTLTAWENGPRLVYTYTGNFTTTPGLSNSITIPPEYAAYITVTAEGDIVLPALRMVWDFSTLPAYDYQEPAARYGLFSHELFNRTISFASDPVSPGLVMQGGGGSVYTNLGGHPIPYHEYLSSGVVHIPIAPEMPRVTYRDIWERAQVMELRTVFYDIVPFPPPEYHAVVNTTFEMLADRDGDGLGDTRVLEFPAREGADLTLYLKSWSNFDPLMPPLRQDETLIAQGMFRGLGFALEPQQSTWWDSWRSPELQGVAGATILTDIISVPAYDYLYFQQYLESQKREAIYISATLSTYPNFHREGVMKIDDGARFVYHQKAVGPNRYEVYDAHVQAVFGLSADARVYKAVVPTLVATFDDQVYHLLRIEDPWDPRCVGWEPFIKSYGFGDLAATVYVGGRHGPDLLWPRVAPGEKTQIRLEIRNNQNGITLTNLILTPTAPAGIIVTPRSISETQAIEPLFFDFPFLHQTTVPDGGRTVWYYDVEVGPTFTDTGKVQRVGFEVHADGLPAYFQIPAAEIGVGSPNECIQTLWGQATDLRLDDRLPPWVTLQDARLANASEVAELKGALALGDLTSAVSLFGNLRAVSFITAAVSGGTHVTFTLPVSDTYDATQMPWLENGVRSGEMYVIFKSRVQIEKHGTALVNDGPSITYADPFGQIYTHIGNRQTVEAHGAELAATYTIDAITNTLTGEVMPGVARGVPNRVALTLKVFNQGDYIAKNNIITVTFPSGVALLASDTPTVAQGADWIALTIPDLALGTQTDIHLVLELVPHDAGPWTLAPLSPPDTYHLIAYSDGRYIHEFPFAAITPREVMVVERLAGALEVGHYAPIYRLWLPVVLRHYSQPWWPTR